VIPYLTVSGLLSLAQWILLLLPVYLSDRGWSSQTVGWAVGTYFLLYLVGQIFAGPLADRFGHVRVALLGTGVGILGGIAYIGALWYPAVIFPARALHATGAAMVYVGALMKLLESVPIKLRGRFIGYYGLPGFATIGIGPAVAEWFSYHWSFVGVFLTIPLMFAIVGGALWRLPREESVPAPAPAPLLEALHDSFKPLKEIVVFSVLFGFCFSSWNSFLAPAVRSLGHGGVSGFGIGYGAGAMATRLGLSRLLDRGPARYIGISTLVLYGACLAWIPLAGGVGHLVWLGCIGGMVHGIYYPSLSSVAAERFHSIHTGQAMSLYVSASSLGMFVGPPALGALVDAVGFARMFWAAGGLMAVGTVAFVYLERPHH
jgi:MFS family permease